MFLKNLILVLAAYWGASAFSSDLKVLPLEVAVPNNLTELLVNPSDYPSAHEFKLQALTPHEVITRLLRSRYAIISAGPNLAIGEKPIGDEPEFYEQRHQALLAEIKGACKKGRACEGGALVDFVEEVREVRCRRPSASCDKVQEVIGRYGSQEERSLFIHFTAAQTVADLEFERQWLLDLGARYKQDSVIYSMHGLQFLIYTTAKYDSLGQASGEAPGSLVAGLGMQVFKEKPQDNYTRFETKQGGYYFSLDFDFEALLADWAAWYERFCRSNAARYRAFAVLENLQGKRVLTTPLFPKAARNKRPVLLITRGVEAYREWAEAMVLRYGPYMALQAINKDSHILQYEAELYAARPPLADRSRAGVNFWSFRNTHTRTEAAERMQEAAQLLMQAPERPHLIVGAMNKRVEDLRPWLLLAERYGYKPLVVTTGELINRYEYLGFLQANIDSFESWEASALSLDLPTGRGLVRQVHADEQTDFAALLTLP